MTHHMDSKQNGIATLKLRPLKGWPLTPSVMHDSPHGLQYEGFVILKLRLLEGQHLRPHRLERLGLDLLK